MNILFNSWLSKTRKLQEEAYKVDYDSLLSDTPEGINSLVEYIRWNMLAIDDELAEVRKAISWKPWQHDDPYADRKEIVKECVDVLHFVANILCAAGATDEELDAEYLAKMQKNADRQKKGYRVLDEGVKCKTCFRALDDYDVNNCGEKMCPNKVEWEFVSANKFSVGDVVRVKIDAYSGDVGDIHNGRLGAVINVKNGDVVIKSIDGILPELHETHHSPNVLEKRVQK
jgi:hypothetical protein